MTFLENPGHLSFVLNDPKSANALTLESVNSLQKKLRAKSWPLLTVSAEGRVFCSGGPLKELSAHKTKQQGLRYHQQISASLRKLAKYPTWKVAFVSGDCFGGGIEFLSCFDEVYCEPHVLFGFWQNRLGVSYGWGGYERLKTKMPTSFLTSALIEEKVVTAREMQKLGFVTGILSAEAMQEKSIELQKLFSQSDSKKEIMKGLEKNEKKLFEKLWWTDEHRNRLQKILK